MNRLKFLCEPVQVGSLYLNNRMVRAPMHSFLCWESGEVSQQLVDMYENSARNGVALIVVEETAIDGRHTGKTELRIDDRRFEPGLHRLVEAIHVNGVPGFIQLCHRGMWGKDPVSPSGVACYGSGRTTYLQPRIMSLAEVEELRDLFIAGAVRAKNVGFDGVVIHGASSYLLEQFVSPHTNTRTDKYGGTFEKRCALSLEIVQGIRERCGPSFAIGYSMVTDELLPDGITLDQGTAFAKALERQGVNLLDLRIGTYETSSSDPRGGISYRQGRGIFDISETFKKMVSIPIFVSCTGEHNPIKWEEAIAKGQCDVIQAGRPLLCDPELPKKVVEGRIDDIRLCIRCNYCIETGPIRGWQLACALNPELGRERDYELKRIPCNPKTILVVGGGPGGLEAARVAAIRGHNVTLMEKQDKLGGNLRVGSFPPGKQEYQNYFGDWLERQCKKARVKIELNKEVTVETIKEFRPDAVILATGSEPLVPPIRDINKRHVVPAADVLNGKASLGKKVIIAGGGEVGVETADYISSKLLAKSITIIEMLPELASDMTTHNRAYMLISILPKSGVNVFTNMAIDEITDTGIVTTDREGKRHKFEADTIVIAMGYSPNTSLYNALKDEIPELYRIGDCVKPRNIADAIREASYIARHI